MSDAPHIPAYLRDYAEGQKSAARAEEQATALALAPQAARQDIADAWRTSALSALGKFRAAARKCPNPEAKALILAQAAKWAAQTGQDKVAIKLLNQGIAIASDDTADTLRKFLASAKGEQKRLIILPGEQPHGD